MYACMLMFVYVRIHVHALYSLILLMRSPNQLQYIHNSMNASNLCLSLSLIFSFPRFIHPLYGVMKGEVIYLIE